MNHKTSDRLAHLKAYQIVCIAALTSTVAALSVLFAVRKTMQSWAKRILNRQDNALPPGYVRDSSQPVPDHFSETIIIPGITETGRETSALDAVDGRSPEGV